ncbi:hypothetical protein XA3_18940 [Xylocopilactobacillus apicola]|uniref:Uncharacterized protein n=1 Tax=Xylocopilactobacillus apicola TaxID=2932184 RepID=A0AAU9DVE9_9LACO|nr:hypothetical protein XA3_18940 [Xylocopilactobacillus apicola]
MLKFRLSELEKNPKSRITFTEMDSILNQIIKNLCWMRKTDFPILEKVGLDLKLNLYLANRSAQLRFRSINYLNQCYMPNAEIVDDIHKSRDDRVQD